MNQEDLDDIAEVGQESTFLSWINNELDLHLANTIMMAILVVTPLTRLENVEPNLKLSEPKNATDAFTFVGWSGNRKRPSYRFDVPQNV